MGVDRDEFSDRDPIAFDAVQPRRMRRPTIRLTRGAGMRPTLRSPRGSSRARSQIPTRRTAQTARALPTFPGRGRRRADAVADANHPAGASARDIDRHTFATAFLPGQTRNGEILRKPYPAAARRGDPPHDRRQQAWQLPWLKLASFGDKRSKNNCLRTNDNLIEISGVEGDHDSGELPFDAAIAIMREGAYPLPALHLGVVRAGRQGALARHRAAVEEPCP